MYQLITEMFSVFSWYEGTLEERVQTGATRILKGLSIFTGTVATEEALAAPKKKKNPYKRREDFMSDREYGQYVKATLENGMRVRARVNYESVSEGDYGTYKQTNEGTPPAQFAWDGLGGDTYWLYWHQVEILPPASEDQEEKNQGTMFVAVSLLSFKVGVYLYRWDPNSKGRLLHTLSTYIDHFSGLIPEHRYIKNRGMGSVALLSIYATTFPLVIYKNLAVSYPFTLNVDPWGGRGLETRLLSA